MQEEDLAITIDCGVSEKKNVPAHRHSDLEMHMVIRGSGQFGLDGRTYPVGAGEFIAIDSDVLHQIWCSPDFETVCVHVKRQFLETYVPELEHLRLVCDAGAAGTHAQMYQAICRKLEELPQLIRQKPFGYALYARAAVMEVLFLLVNGFSVRRLDDESGPKDSHERTACILDYVEKHYREALTLEMISEQLGLSREYFSRLFKKTMGMNFSRHLQLVRLAHIYDDLEHTNDSIMDIAGRHGFGNYKLFTKLFREIYGCMPRDVRKSQQAVNAADGH